MADERTGIKYIGREPYYKDRIFGTGLVWKSGEALPLAVEVAKEFLKHPTLFQEVKGLTPLMGSTTSSGGVGNQRTVLQIGDNSAPMPATLPHRRPGLWDILDPRKISEWNADVSAPLTVAVDSDVKWGGRSTIRITIPAGTSGAKVLFGTSSTLSGRIPEIPVPWDWSETGVVIMTDNPAITTSCTLYVGDTGLTNCKRFPFPWANGESADDLTPGRFEVLKCLPESILTTGSPVPAGRMRVKMDCVLTAQASDVNIWIAAVGIIPKPKIPRLVMSCDDGHYNWWKFQAELAKYYDIPITMALIGSNVDVTIPENYFEGFKKMRDDPSCLFSYTNHGYFSKRYLGNVSEMVEDYDRARAEMARVGASELEQRTVAYPYGAHDKALVNALIDAGYYSARGGDYRFPATRSALWGAGDSTRMAMALITSADSVNNSYAAVTTAIDNWRTTVGDTASIVWHVPAETDGAPGVTQIGRQKMEQLFQFVAGERDAGRIVLTSLAAITSQFTGIPTDRR